jgi:hypothetical protein
MAEPKKKPHKHVQGRGGVYSRKKGEGGSAYNKRIVAYNTKKTKQTIALREGGISHSADYAAKPKKPTVKQRASSILNKVKSGASKVKRGAATAKAYSRKPAKTVARKVNKSSFRPKIR